GVCVGLEGGDLLPAGPTPGGPHVDQGRLTAQGGTEIDLDGAQVYGEKNWGKGGFPHSWWWGQAQGFADRQACVAFAGGEITAGGLRTEVTAVVVALP
ncbi:tocopherol cyclase family protein, partial [Rhodococcus fascians]